MGYRIRHLLIVAVGAMSVALGASCSKGGASDSASSTVRPNGNRPPVVMAAKILNAPLSQAAPVSVQIQAEDPEREAVTYQYQWYANDAPIVGQTSPTLPPGFLRRGQRISVEIVPADPGQKGQAYRTAAVMVGNSPPMVVSVVLQPAGAGEGSRVEALAEVTDPDHDRVDLTYRWFQGDTLVKEGEESSLSVKALDPRLPVLVEVIASDPEAAGKPLRSAQLMVSNHPPQIISVPPGASGAGGFEYIVKAVDEDGDPIMYQLEQAPFGMTIDGTTGRLYWAVPAGSAGAFHIKVLAKDGQGSMAYQEFDVTFTKEGAPGKPAGA